MSDKETLPSEADVSVKSRTPSIKWNANPRFLPYSKGQRCNLCRLLRKKGVITKLSLDEILVLISYIGKWLKKYESFPLAILYPEASNLLGLNTCQWVPTVKLLQNLLQ